MESQPDRDGPAPGRVDPPVALPPLGALARRAASGHEASWRTLVERLSGAVWATARAHRLDEADAADVAQTVWLRLLEHLERIDDLDRVGGWVMTTTRRECLRALASGRRTVPLPAHFEPPDPRPGPDGYLTGRERDAALRDALAQLTERCQLLLRLLSLDPAPGYLTISAALDMPVGSIGPTRARCLDRLRRECADRGITEPS